MNKNNIYLSAWQDFFNLLKSVATTPYLNDFLDLFLTDTEKNAIALRSSLVKELLVNKKKQREIAQDLHISIAKITRGSNYIKRINPKFKKFLQERLLSIKKL